MLRAALTRRTISQIRSIHKSSVYYAASVFKMPAMSPTMSEGGIVSWKVKPGQDFNAGDVLLEVETDKANIDVEANEDGKLWEILINEGTSGIPVGKPIAFIAEQDDDLSTLTKPSIEDVTPPASQASTPAEQVPAAQESPAAQEAAPAKTTPADTSILQKANPEQKLPPGVEFLLHENHISNEEAFSKIQASGPNGRLLKGDVLAYIGKINTNSIISLTEFLRSREHLDLSNIVLAQPSAETEAKSEDKKGEEQAAKAEKPKPKNILTVELTSNLGEDISQAKFKYAFEQSVASAIRHTYATKFPEFANSPTGSSIYDKYDVFDDIISAPVTKNRFEVYDIKYKFYGEEAAIPKPVKQVKVDEFDELLGLSTPVQYLETGSSNVGVQFKIKFDDKVGDSKQFVESFENLLLSQIPANKLKITNL